MEFLEKDLEQIIFESSFEKLKERGLYVYGKRKRQFKIGNYGIADMITFTRPYYHPVFNSIMKGRITVYEFKKDKVNVSTFLQAMRYIKGIQRYLSIRDKENLFNFEVVLIGKELDLSSSFSYLTDIISSDIYEKDIDSETAFSLEVLTYNYTIDGLEFNREYGYKLTDEGFKL